MGMFDTMGDHQVKCFYKPTVLLKKAQSENDELLVWESGGSLNFYKRFSKVPYKTMYYDYGKDFMIFHTCGVGEGVVHIVKFGRYIKTVHHTELNTRLCPIRSVFSQYGEELAIEKKKDFERFLMDKDHVEGLQGDLLGTERESFYKRWFTNEKNCNGGWRIGGFLKGLVGCDPEKFQLYVECFKRYIDESGGVLVDELREYEKWCTEHKIRINAVKLWWFFNRECSARQLCSLLKSVKI